MSIYFFEKMWMGKKRCGGNGPKEKHWFKKNTKKASTGGMWLWQSCEGGKLSDGCGRNSLCPAVWFLSQYPVRFGVQEPFVWNVTFSTFWLYDFGQVNIFLPSYKYLVIAYHISLSEKYKCWFFVVEDGLRESYPLGVSSPPGLQLV